MKGRLAPRIMLHPALLVALALLLLNDHFLKTATPGWVTGKLSDIAGLVVFPLLILSIMDLTIGITSSRPTRTVAIVLVVTAAAFIAIQVLPSAAEAYRQLMGWLQFPFRALQGATSVGTVRHVADATDLLALPALTLAWWVAVRSTQTESEEPCHG